MATTTVRIDRQHKAHLERLRGEWRRRTGRAPTQQELLGHLLDYAGSHLDAIIDEMAWRPLTPEEIEAVFEEAIDVGRPLDLTTDIDATVYDWDREMGNK